MTEGTIPVGDVEFVKELYPRLREDDAAIERYRASIDRLPPITIARGRVLVDGFHRWQAHRRENIDKIPYVDLGNLTDAEIFNESIRRNATHGHQLSSKDKQNLAGKLWQTLAHLPGSERVAELADLLAVSERSVQGWTKDARAAEKAALQAKAFDLWLDCWTQQAIADEIDVPQQTLAGWLTESRNFADFGKAPESIQHFDVWPFHKIDPDAGGTLSYFGNMPPQVVENLMWLYTQPGDIVFDPFAGGGTTIDVAKRMGRRVWSSDLNPSTPTLPIHQHDITTGWPEDAPNKVDFVLLDPPYWQQAKGRYSNDPEDLANMDYQDFLDSWYEVIRHCKDHLAENGRIAYIISPTQTDDGAVIDHAFDMYLQCFNVGLQIERRVIVPYSTQQATGQQVTWARDNKRLLKLYRDLVVLQ